MNPIIIPVEDRIDKELVKIFKEALQKIPKEVKGVPLILRILSYGGSVEAFSDISNYLYFMSKYREFTPIAEAEYAESAAMLLFLNCPIRRVRHSSKGVIHLPVLNKSTSKISLEEERRRVITFISKKTGLSAEQIISLDGKQLNSEQMVALGIATEFVKNFSNSISKKAA